MHRSALVLVVAAFGLSAAFTAPAIAKPRNHLRALPQNQYNQIVAPTGGASCVYRGGNLVGCDPDANIRQRLQNSGYGGGPA